MRFFNYKVKIMQIMVTTKYLVILCLLILDIFVFNFVFFAYDSVSKHMVKESKEYALYKRAQLIYAETVPIKIGWKVKSALLGSVLLSYGMVFLFSHKITVESLPKENA